ncbi:phospholipid carrier-dependent glycosyltransferase [Cellulomonas soli]
MGKWMIALGLHLGGGVESSAAWRLSAAVCGTLAVLMIARIGRRLFASTALGTVAGLLLAVDGEAIVHSRISLLDPFLMFFVLAAFGALLIDRDQARTRLAERTAVLLDEGRPLGLGPRLGWRWWRLAAAVLLGLAIGTKWSGIYFLAMFGLMSVLWDLSARRTVGVRPWVWAGCAATASWRGSRPCSSPPRCTWRRGGRGSPRATATCGSGRRRTPARASRGCPRRCARCGSSTPTCGSSTPRSPRSMPTPRTRWGGSCSGGPRRTTTRPRCRA